MIDIKIKVGDIIEKGRICYIPHYLESYYYNKFTCHKYRRSIFTGKYVMIDKDVKLSELDLQFMIHRDGWVLNKAKE